MALLMQLLSSRTESSIHGESVLADSLAKAQNVSRSSSRSSLECQQEVSNQVASPFRQKHLQLRTHKDLHDWIILNEMPRLMDVDFSIVVLGLLAFLCHVHLMILLLESGSAK